MRTTTSSASISSSAIVGSPRTGVEIVSSSMRLDVARPHVGPQARAQVDRGGLAQRHDGRGEHDVVRDHDRVLALRDVV